MVDASFGVAPRVLPVDGVADLLEAIAFERGVPLPWVVRWSAAGGDPVAAAWAASACPVAMLCLLDALGRTPEAERVARVLDAARPACGACADLTWPAGEFPPDDLLPPMHPCPGCAAAVRAAVTAPPTLAAVLARLEACRAR